MDATQMAGDAIVLDSRGNARDGSRIQLVRVRENGLPALLVQVRVPPGIMAQSLPVLERRLEELLGVALNKVVRMVADDMLGGPIV